MPTFEMNPVNLHRYLDFVEDRHMAWARRRMGMEYPVDNDIVTGKKFTNVFRILDPGTQYVLRLMDEPGITPRDALARAFLYRMTNRPQTWDFLLEEWKHWPRADEMEEQLAWVLQGYRDAGNQVFSGAYIIMPEPGVTGVDKTYSVVMLAHRLFHPDSPEQIVTKFLAAGSMAQRFAVLRSQKGIGDFIAMQVLTDFNYSHHGNQDWWTENTFVVPGPGCRKGVKEVTPTRDVVGFLSYAQFLIGEKLPNVDLRLLGSDRKPSLMDVQNTFCEFSKYMRYYRAHRDGKLRLGRYQPTHNERERIIKLPAHWQH